LGTVSKSRNFMVTIKARAKRDPVFRKRLLREIAGGKHDRGLVKQLALHESARTLVRRRAWWTYDDEACACYIELEDRRPAPYLEQRHFEAILDIASDGTLAGVELLEMRKADAGRLPPPPKHELELGILDGANSVWGVRIPDVPGCYGAGDTPEAALADAISALREVAAHHAAEGVALNPPRSMKDIIHDKGAHFNPRAGESLVMVPLLLDRHRSVKANISLDAGLLEVIDAEAKRRGLTRSAFLTSAALGKITGSRPTTRGMRARTASRRSHQN
jgi:predicted RNase H-like HicB family nuclease